MKYLFGLVLMVLAMNVSAYAVYSSGSATNFGDNYGYDLSIDSTDGLTWDFSLTNSSIAPPSDSLIDAFAMNMTASLGTDFSVLNFNPDTWTFSESSGGVLFDYIGERGVPGDRLGIGDELTFQFLFGTAVDTAVWMDAVESLGAGIGGGTDLGQFAVSFQQLGLDGEESDLIASNYSQESDDPNPNVVSEPGILALMGIGLVGLGVSASRREERKLKKNRKCSG